MKEKISKFISPLGKEVSLILLLTALSFFITARFVNLIPEVDNNFFFSSSDPQFQSEQEISHLFQRKDTQLVISARGDIASEKYEEKIEKLSDTLESINGVTSVKSLTHGPSSLKDALKSPLWKRIIIANDRKSTNIIVILDDSIAQDVTLNVEKVVDHFSEPSFELMISGLPYVVELISRYLIRDLRVFSFTAFIIFGLVIFAIFRSKSILAGMMISCLNACLWTLMITDLIGVPIGILTANLATIVFVLTLSHMVFLTFNWKNLCHSETHQGAIDKAVAITLEASLWSMLTTLLGFLSLFLVPAKPLRELGVAGSIGTVVAIVVAYAIYPSFLRLPRAHKHETSKTPNEANKFYNYLEHHKFNIRLLIVFFCIIAIPGLWKINKDPSMLSFFDKNSEIHKGLEYIDRNGGSSPLIIVVQSKDGELLNSQDAYKDLWKLQEALELHRSVGSVISLPVLMAQAKQEPLAFLFWDWLLNILEQPEYGEIAKSFITKNRESGLFLLRMNELNRVQTRLDVIEELHQIVDTYDFVPQITGGVYKLQGHLSKLVSKSLVSGLFKLLIAFIVIAWLASRSIKVSFAMIVSLLLIPVGILGALGLYRIPLDVVSSPASNVAIAMGIDSMIHMIKARQRRLQNNKSQKNVWKKVRDEMWQPILTSMTIVITGFAIFLFSTFPPTQRFGGAIVFGTLLAGLTALYIMPLLAVFPQKQES